MLSRYWACLSPCPPPAALAVGLHGGFGKQRCQSLCIALLFLLPFQALKSEAGELAAVRNLLHLSLQIWADLFAGYFLCCPRAVGHPSFQPMFGSRNVENSFLSHHPIQFGAAVPHAVALGTRFAGSFVCEVQKTNPAWPPWVGSPHLSEERTWGTKNLHKQLLCASWLGEFRQDLG